MLKFHGPDCTIVCCGCVLESHPQHMSRVVRKPAFCICENKDADQLRGNRKADQRLCFLYIDSTIPLPHKSEISSLVPSSVAVQPGLCRTWSETPKTGFLTMRLNRKADLRLCFRYRQTDFLMMWLIAILLLVFNTF